MKLVLKHINYLIAVLIAISFVISTSGFSIYQHSCSNSQVENVSIIVPAEKCDHADIKEQVDSCCEPIETTSCCETEQKTENKDCCHDKQEFKKLEIKTITSSEEIEVKALNTLIVEMLYSSTLLANTAFLNNFNTTSIEPPPPLLVSEHLAQIQVYII